MSKKVAFYFDNSRISQVDCRDIESGNPGIGGTEYLFLLISNFTFFSAPSLPQS